MARYEPPDDPRDSELRPARSRRYRNGGIDWVPWVGLLLGLVVTIIALFFAVELARRIVQTPPIEGVIPMEPTIIRLTPPVTRTPTPTPLIPTPTLFATLTPTSTEPIQGIVPETIEVGVYAQVANTGGVGVRMRGGPSTDNTLLLVLSEGEVGLVTNGPTEGGGFNWWELQLTDGTKGWVVSEFLLPSAEP